MKKNNLCELSFPVSVADESLKLDEKTENILADAFNLLVDNEKKISEAITRSKKGNNEEVEEIEEVNAANPEPKKAQSGQSITINEVKKSLPSASLNLLTFDVNGVFKLIFLIPIDLKLATIFKQKLNNSPSLFNKPSFIIHLILAIFIVTECSTE